MAERVARSADALVVPTETVARQLAEHVPLRREPVVVGLGVTAFPTVTEAEADRRARALGLPGGGYVLSVATVEPRKGLDVLIAALADPAAPRLPLVLVGSSGWGGISVADLCRSVGLARERVVELGRVDDTDLGVTLSRASVVAVPSRAEGFGLPVLEGMAAGVPVVVSDAPALVEVAGGAAMVAPVGDTAATARALADAVADTDRLVHAGRTRSASFTWDATAAALESVYASVL